MTTRFNFVGKPRLLSHSVVDAIERSIRKRELTPGMKLESEHELCTQFGVSRTVLREALRMLSARGLIRIEKGRGIFISQLSPETVTTPLEMYLHQHEGEYRSFDIIRARQLIEPPIAAEAAIKHTQADAEQLTKDYDDMLACDGDSKKLAELDMAFHRHIAEACGNALVPLLIVPIYALMPSIKHSVHQVIEEARYSAIEWHGRILKAIIDRNAEEARSNMAYHLIESERHIAQMMGTEAGSDETSGKVKGDRLASLS